MELKRTKFLERLYKTIVFFIQESKLFNGHSIGLIWENNDGKLIDFKFEIFVNKGAVLDK